jgi:hypothetical protein
MLAAAAEPIKAAAPIATPPHLSIISSADCKFKNEALCVVLFDLRLFFSQHISQWQKGARFSLSGHCTYRNISLQEIVGK